MAGAESEDSLVSIFESMETIDEIKERSLRIDSLHTPGTIYQEALPLLGLDKIKKYQTNFKEFPMSTLMVELPVTKLQPMGWSNWVESPWFYVGLTLAVIFTLGICIKMRKTVRKMGSICCGSCWSRCRRRDGDGGEEDSSKGTSYCYVNPETQTSNQTIELRNISASKYPELARRYLKEKATMYVKQLEEYRRVLQKGILPSARNLYIRWYPWSMNLLKTVKNCFKIYMVLFRMC